MTMELHLARVHGHCDVFLTFINFVVHQEKVDRKCGWKVKFTYILNIQKSRQYCATLNMRLFLSPYPHARTYEWMVL